MSNIKGFKVFKSDWTCRSYQYEVGKTFKHNGNIELCGSGFHFCQKASDCFNYYGFDSNNKVAEVLATGLVESGDDKSVTDELIIVREIPWTELLTIVNEGKDCTGLCNTGNRNTGDWNTGDWNTGDWNTGDCNTADFSTGVFCAQEEKIKIFDKQSDLTYRDWINSRARDIIRWNMETTVWVYEENMSTEEKEQYPTYKTTGGYLKVFSYKEAWSNLWNNLTDSEKQEIKNIPNFDSEKFKEITGIKVE